MFDLTNHVALVTGDRGLEKILLEHVTRSHEACREAVAATLAGASQPQPDSSL